MRLIRTVLGALAVCLLLAPVSFARESEVRSRPSHSAEDDFDRGYEAGYAAAVSEYRRPDRQTYQRPSYVSEYTPFNPYAWQNRPRVSMPAAVSAARDRTDVRGRTQQDEYANYPGAADYLNDRRDRLAGRGRIYDPGDFRDEQGGIYGNRGVLMWTDRYDTGDYVNKFWNTHRDRVYSGQRVWNTNNGHQ